MFLREFQNGRKAEHLNKSLAHKPVLSFVKVVTSAKYYIKIEESNIEKKVYDINDHAPNAKGSRHLRNNNYTSSIKDKDVFRRVGKTMENFTPVNTLRE